MFQVKKEDSLEKFEKLLFCKIFEKSLILIYIFKI